MREYVWLDDVPVAVFVSHAGTTYQYILTDHLNTPRAVVVPTTNTIVWRWDLTGSAFGEHADAANPDGDANSYTMPLRYPGQYHDTETALYYNYFRDFDPGVGRYLQSDPIGLDGGMSTYAYVGANPLKASDRFGLADGMEHYNSYGPGGAPSRLPCNLSARARACMGRALSVSDDTIRGVKISTGSLYAHTMVRYWFSGSQWATTLPGDIYYTGSCGMFKRNPWLMLHEYYHVIRLWGSGMTVRSYLENSDRRESEANRFAARMRPEFLRCMEGDCS